MRTLIYARYSSQLQNPRSIEDQLAACRARAKAEGWEIVGEYHDRAISGAAGIDESQRPGLAALLERVTRGGIEQILTESTDRIARHQGDAFAVRELIEHAGARLFTLMDGVVDDITGTIKSLFDARTRKDLAQRVRRGHHGNLAEGRAASGIAFGYRRVIKLDAKGEPIRGLRDIDPEKAAIVQRIFREYRDGASARAIAKGLNVDGIPAPRGGSWRASTLAGHRCNSLAILCNPVYIGKLLYGRTRSVTDPRTRKRSTRSGTGDIAIGDAPHLRIIDDATWHAVQQQLEERSAGAPERQRRPRHLLSKLGQCGNCGANWIITRGEYFGCSGVVDGSTCSNRRLITKAEYERRVLAELKDQMLAPDVVDAYLEEYREEHTRRARKAVRERAQLERCLAEAQRKAANLVTALAEGGNEFAEIRAALASAKAQAAEARQQLAGLDALPAIALHPGLAQQYRKAIEQLHEELADEETRKEAAPRLRKLIARIVVTPSEGKRGVELEVVRHIDEVLALAESRRRA